MNARIKINRVKIGYIGKVILGFVAVAGMVSVLAVFPGIAYAIAPFIKKKKYSPKQIVERNIDSLIRNGLLKKTLDKNGEYTLELTRRGKWEALLRFPSQDTTSAAWDGLWRVIVFDIPQKKHKERAELRRAMKLYGFKLLQKSVWVYPYACDDFVSLLKDKLGISHDVLYMKVAHIENEKHLKKEFGL